MLKKLFPYIGDYGRDAVKAPLLVALETICELILPLLMARIIDVGINGGGGISYILQMGGIMLVLAAISMFCGVSAAKYAAIGSQGFGANLRKALFNKVQEFSFADIDRFSSGSLITRMTNDVNAIQMMVAMGLRILVRAPVMLIAALGVCFTMNARLTLVLVVIIPIMTVAIFILMKICQRLFEIMQEKIDGLNNSIQENLIAIRVVKAFVRERYEKKKFRQANDALTRAALSASMRIILMSPIMMFSMYASIMGILWFGGRAVAGGTMLTGDLYSFISYIGNILMSVLMVAMSLLQLTRAKACANRILEVLETEPDIQDGTGDALTTLPPSLGKVEFQDVSFRYGSGGTGDDVLSHINLDIQPGEFVAIIGGTDVGKSSLVNLIPRFYDVTGGHLLVDGVDVRDYPVQQLRERIGMVLQTNVLFSGTIRENLLWGNPNATEEELIQAAKNAQAYDFVMSFPDGFDTYIEQGGVNVSGGQKQRLCIARAMLRHPAILILDDSTSAVDSATEALIRQSFHENLKGTTVIIIAQRISSVREADHIVVLEDDHIAAYGTHEELMETSSIYQEIYNSQQEGVKE
jgi:ATP-binding cassette subfamily B multidrug efflux pump